ncbi:MAG TPA: ABC transporter permease [Polyangia bacterium]|nr:ABC transporter permease [Polyangia bacterium]
MIEGRTLRLIAGRFAASLPSLLGVVVITFFLMRALPGDPAAFFAGPAATPEAVEQVRHQLGLDRSLPTQLTIYLRDLARGDLGKSITTGQPVRAELWNRLPASLELTLSGLFLAALIGLPLGVLAATRPGSVFDHASRLLSTAGVSLPTFFTGLVLIYVFYFKLGWAPAPMGRLDSFTDPPRAVTGFLLIDSLLAGSPALFWAALKQLALPATTLALFAMAPLARMTRAAMLAVLSSDYIRAARAAGLGRFQVLVVYGFRNALLPVLTTLGMVFSFLLGANVLVEKVFAWPGLGSFALEALLSSDYAPVQGFVLVMGTVYVLLNLFIDVLYGLVDPRAKVAR